MKYTIEDLRNGKCAVINDGTKKQLNELLDLVDNINIHGKNNYFFKIKGVKEWIVQDSTSLPTQSVKDFLEPKIETESKDTEITKRDYYLAIAMQGFIIKGFSDENEIINKSKSIVNKILN